MTDGSSARRSFPQGGYMYRLLIAAATALVVTSQASAQVRIKDITDVSGARGNQLFGFGLVVGLDGTGSRSTFTQQIAVDMLQRMGTTTQIFSQLPAESVLRSTSISAVMVTAELGPFARKGGKVDVTVSAIDDARSLQGGTLIFTPLRGADGNVYALAQGPLSIGGFSVTVGGGGVQKNHVNVGRIPSGGLIEKEAPGELVRDGKATLLLKDPDFNTARLIAKTINERYPGTASAADPGAVVLCQPTDLTKSATQLIAEVGLLEVRPDIPARIVINERTGTIVAGEHVALSPTAVAHGNLYIGVSINPLVSQPAPFSGGVTTVVPRVQVASSEQQARLVPLPKSTTVSDVARTMNALGVTPRDLIAIFQAMKKAGALHAELIIE
ncbi:flagellar basal body P-ring protein FlgI [Gemmata massiliana]|nr:flagellar basal body P-ring protein FlgI [Gemmata massiliana]